MRIRPHLPIICLACVAGCTGGASTSSGGDTGGSGGASASNGGAGGQGGSGAGQGSSGNGGAAGAGSGGSGGAAGRGQGGSSGAGGSTADAGAGGPSTYVNPFGCKFGWGEPAPSSLASVASSLQFVTSWAGYEITAAGDITSCNNCTGFLRQAAATSLVPVYYAYLIGYYGHVNNLPDQNACPNPSNPGATMTCPKTTPNLTTGMAWLLLSDPNGANAPCGSTTTFCAQNKIVEAYAFYAQKTAAAWPTKPLIWLLEGDFIQYTDASQVNSTTTTSGTKVGLTPTQLGQLAALITTAIKTNMPNAIVAIDHSDWIASAQAQAYWAAMAQANYDMVWTTGPGNMNGVVGASVKYADLQAWTGRKIYVDAWTDTWSNQSAATINALIGAGVVAFNSNTPPGNYTTLVPALEAQLSSTCP